MRQFFTFFLIISLSFISFNSVADTNIEEKLDQQAIEFIQYINTNTIGPKQRSIVQHYVKNILETEIKKSGSYQKASVPNVSDECSFGFIFMLAASSSHYVSQAKAREVVGVICTSEDIKTITDHVFKPANAKDATLTKIDDVSISEHEINMEKSVLTFHNISRQCQNNHKEKQAIFECETKEIEVYAKNGDYIAQYFLAIRHNNSKNKNLALQWIQTCIDNPKTPDSFKGAAIKIAKLIERELS